MKGGCYEITTADSRDEPSLNEGHSFTLCVRHKGNLFNCSWRIIASQWCDGSSVRPCEPARSAHGCPPPTSPLPVVTEPRLRVPRVPHHSLWRSVLRLVMYMFQCYSLKSSHLLLLLFCNWNIRALQCCVRFYYTMK